VYSLLLGPVGGLSGVYFPVRIPEKRIHKVTVTASAGEIRIYDLEKN